MAPGPKAPAPSRLSRSERPVVTSVAELARYLGLSDWTVSRAINGHTEVNSKTRERVERAMEELGFRPNPLARGLRGVGTGLVGICFNRLNISIINEKILYLQEFLRKNNLRSLLEVTFADKDNERQIIEDFRRIRTDGVVFVHPELSWTEASGILKEIPCVFVDPPTPQKSPGVSLNRTRAMQSLLDHLWTLGHRRFALIAINKSDMWRSIPLIDQVKKYNANPEETLMYFPPRSEGSPSIESGRLIVSELIKSGKYPSAFIAFNDLVAFGAVQALRDAGIDVPGRVSVTGFDNSELAAQMRPRLTTIEQNPRGMMERAAAILVEQIAHSTKGHGHLKHEIMPPELIVGDSTGPVFRPRRAV